MSAGIDFAASMRDAGFRGEIARDEPLAPLTTWRIGGPAELLVTPANTDDLARALEWAIRAEVPWRILGNGSNLLVRDEGVRGVVVRVRRKLDRIAVEPPRIIAEAGASFPAVANMAAKHGLAGLEFAAGIPGTVGGAVVMNAGWHEFETGCLIEYVDVLEPGGTRHARRREQCEFVYRSSAFRGKATTVLAASFLLSEEDPASIRSRMEIFAGSRKANQPTDLPSCGSVFLKPQGDYAGRLIEEAGLKGLRIGDVEISHKHANFFVNVGHATSRDVLTLVERVEHEVESRFGVTLQREFELW